MKPDMTMRPRIAKLREYYMKHSAMVINRDLVPWLCEHSERLYIQGWIKNAKAPTSRLRRAMARAHMLTYSEPIICPGELIVGQPNFRPMTTEERAQFDECRKNYRDYVPPIRGRADHTALDYPKLLTYGVEGLIAEAAEKLAALDPYDGRCAEKYEFYKCCIIELEGVLRLAAHYAAKAREMAETADGTEKTELLELAQTLDRVPAKPARTFREALQCLQLFMYSLYGIYSMGRPDQYLLPYYQCDLAAGIMTEADAQELIDCFCLQYMNNMSAWAAAGFMIGGRDENGTPVENALTWHFMASIGHTHTPDPNVGFCVTAQTSPELLKFAVEQIKAGNGNPQIWNNDAVTASMRKQQYDEKAANLFTHSTCVEITPIACSGVSITSPYINMLKILSDTLQHCGEPSDFEILFDAFQRDFEAYCREALLQENLWQLERSRINTDPVCISTLIHDCMERGLSSENNGARYNHIEPNMLGMTNVIESLHVLRELVFTQKKVTMTQFRQALADNYDGHEELHAQIVRKTTHFGTDSAETNEMAKRVSDMVLNTFARFTTWRGARVIPGAFSYRDHESNGRVTPATPDGRCDGAVLADGSSPVQGYDNKGPTASLQSTASWQPARFLGGTSVNVKLNADVSVQTLAELIRSVLQTEIAQMQFNITDRAELLDAQQHPEDHRDLLVRIGGYSDYFVRIPKRLQEDVIARSQNRL